MLVSRSCPLTSPFPQRQPIQIRMIRLWNLFVTLLAYLYPQTLLINMAQRDLFVDYFILCRPEAPHQWGIDTNLFELLARPEDNHRCMDLRLSSADGEHHSLGEFDDVGECDGEVAAALVVIQHEICRPARGQLNRAETFSRHGLVLEEQVPIVEQN